MKKTNVSSEVLIFQVFWAKSRPRSKHSSFSHRKYECFERGLDFTEQALKTQQKTHTHTWKHEKDECFERGLDFTENS